MKTVKVGDAEVRASGVFTNGDHVLVNVADVVGPDGLSMRERNMQEEHDIPLGSLVEVNFGKYKGIRLFVGKYSRDCDGEPLYDLVADPELIDFDDEVLQEKAATTRDNTERQMCMIEYWRIQGAFLRNIGRDGFDFIAQPISQD